MRTATHQCSAPDCCDSTGGLSRRGFLGVGAAALIATGLPDGAVAVPAEKNLDQRWLGQLATRGLPTRWSGPALANIGMPVSGACSGQVYLAGDGRLWLWDVFNDDNAYYGGADGGGPHYASPLGVVSPFGFGFALRTGSGRSATTVTLDADGFPDTKFVGRYPVGTTQLRGGPVPAEVDLEAFSPFIPTNVADSELPATVLDYTVRNTGHRRERFELLGFGENPVCLRSRTSQPVRLSAERSAAGGASGVRFAAATEPVDGPVEGDVVFEDWAGDGFGDWTVTGDAFGSGPVAEADLPVGMKRFGSLGTSTGRLVTSYAFRAGDNRPDEHTGRLVSPEFTITHTGISTRVGGGFGGDLRVAVVIDDEVVTSATGLRYEPLRPVHLDVSPHVGKTAHLEIVDEATGFWAHLNCDRIVFTDRPAPMPDVIFEDWSDGTYAGWSVSGSAFGPTPVTEAQTPDYFRREGPLMLLGTYFATSHDFREYGDAGQADVQTGRLTSAEFTIDHRYLVANIGGGSDINQVGLRVVVDGEVVARLAGNNAETLALKTADLTAYRGRTAHLEIADDATGGWGHVNCDRIWFSDLPLRVQPVDELHDAGTFTIAALERGARVRPSLSSWERPADWFDAPDAAATRDDNRQAGAVSVVFTLDPGESRRVRFAVAWSFPRVSLVKFGLIAGAESMRHHYALRYSTSDEVVADLARRHDQLAGDTRAFVRTWYDDSTLPYWLLERTLATASVLATETCQRFDTGRFYGWEGSYCCVGTCTHVWNYAQSIAYLFPELERDTRARVDYGLSFHEDTGAIDYRGEGGRQVAHDGQCGNILCTYREHQQAPSYDFLRSVWPQARKAVEYLIGHDAEVGSGPNGILEADQYNTLDATWYGEIPWISGLYVAALLAGAEMALDMGDQDFARRCRTLAASGSDYLDETLWNERYQYFEQKIDPAHADAINSNRGCYIDQMFGQTYAHQLGLPRVFDADKSHAALRSIFRNNYMPDARSYMAVSGIEGGRTYSADGEPGTLMCTWPFGGAEEAPGSGAAFAVAYFNEVWTGTEWQFAAHLIHEGHVEDGLTVARAIYDRYSATERNPYNEVECSDHYARSMMSYAAYLAVLGFQHHGPRGHLGFDPKLRPEDFRAAFTVGAGWGSFWQKRHGDGQDDGVELRYGELRGLRTLALGVTDGVRRAQVWHTSGRRRRPVPVREVRLQEGRAVVTLASPVDLVAGDELTVHLR